mgnify:FL=1
MTTLNHEDDALTRDSHMTRSAILLPTSPLPLSLPWYLVGLPGSGKSAVGRMLAKELGVAHLDSDWLVERRAGKPIVEIFEDEGEAAFRSIEASVILETGDEEAVVSLGGGAIETPAVREFLKDKTVLWLQASIGELLRRTSRSDTRPLLRGDAEAILKELANRRNPAHREVASLRVWSTRASPRKVVHKLIDQVSDWNRVNVAAPNPYPVIIGAGTRTLVGDAIGSEVEKVLVVVPDTLTRLVRPLLQLLEERGLEVSVFWHPPGEEAKSFSVVSRGWDQLARARLSRTDMVVTFGGGATTDMGGFLAATWLRGIKVEHVPTTLLAMVDAAVGGKTGINTSAGKNLVGAFYDPVRVTVDPELLQSLPQDEYTSGLAEILKAGFISDPEILTLFEQHPKLASVRWATGPGKDVLTEVISRAIRVKANVVGEDRLEAGLRETLNYGHTLAHAIESVESYAVRHGEAVAIGSVFAAELAADLNLIDADLVQRVRSVFSLVGLPTAYEGDFDRLLARMRMDKKVRSDALRFVLLDGVGTARVVEVSQDDLRAPAARIGIRGTERRDDAL